MSNPFESLPPSPSSVDDVQDAKNELSDPSLEHKRRHVIKIAAQLAPEPSAFSLSSYKREQGACTCGQKIEHQFILRSKEGKEVVIGSTCIEATVPYLVSMGAEELVEAVRAQWKNVLAEMRRDRREKVGLEKLNKLVPLGAALDSWLHRVTANLHWLPAYFYSQYIPLYWSAAESPTKKAANIKLRISNFRERIPLIKEALKQAGCEADWEEPPENVEVGPEWEELWTTAKEYRSGFDMLLKNRHRDLGYMNQHVLATIKNMAQRQPWQEEELRVYINGAEMAAHYIPSTDEARSMREQAVEEFAELKNEYKDNSEKIKNFLHSNRGIVRYFPKLKEALERFKQNEFPWRAENKTSLKLASDCVEMAKKVVSLFPSESYLEKLNEYDEVRRDLKSIEEEMEDLDNLPSRDNLNGMVLSMSPKIHRGQTEYQATSNGTTYVLNNRYSNYFRHQGYERFYQIDRTLVDTPGRRVVVVVPIDTKEDESNVYRREELIERKQSLDVKKDALRDKIFTKN